MIATALSLSYLKIFNHWPCWGQSRDAQPTWPVRIAPPHGGDWNLSSIRVKQSTTMSIRRASRLLLLIFITWFCLRLTHVFEKQYYLLDQLHHYLLGCIVQLVWLIYGLAPYAFAIFRPHRRQLAGVSASSFSYDVYSGVPCSGLRQVQNWRPPL